MESTLKNLFSRRDLLRELTLSELRSQAKETRLGWIWWLLDPAFMMLIYWGVIVGIFGRGVQYAPYPVFVLCAMLPWKHFSTAASQACNVLRSKEALIKSVPFPTMILPLSQILAGFAYLVVGMCVLLAAALLFGVSLTPAVVQLVPLLLLQILVVSGICLMLASFGALVHDLVAFVQYVIRMLFYASPTLYGVDMVRERFAEVASGDWLLRIYLLNPFTILFTGYRDAIFYGRFIPAEQWLCISAEALVLLVLGYRIFYYYDRRVIKFL